MAKAISKFERERYCVEQLAASLRLPGSLEYRDPLVDYGRETGIDVVMIGQGRRIGFQVTEYDGGEGVANLGAGRMRADEVRLKRASFPNGVYGGWGSPHFGTAFAARVMEKIDKACKYDFAEVEEIWLLVSAGLPDSPTATFVPHFHISADDLNRSTATILAQSCYAGPFFT